MKEISPSFLYDMMLLPQTLNTEVYGSFYEPPQNDPKIFPGCLMLTCLGTKPHDAKKYVNMDG